MPAKIADHAVTVLFGMLLNCVADVANMVAGFHLLNAQHHTFIGYFHQPPRLYWHIADIEHAAGVAVPSIQHGCYVNVNNVTILQFLVGWDAVADDVIDRNTAAVGISAVAQCGGNAAACDGHAAHNVVEFFG
jgi:hypothetical protein